MNAVIRLDVPDFQIGEPVSVYFKDTMLKKSVCEEERVYVNLVISWLREIAINNMYNNRQMGFVDAVEEIRDRAATGLANYLKDKGKSI